MAYKRISPIPIIEGGTGAVTLTNHGVILGQGTSALAATAVGTTGQVLTGVTASDPVWASPAASSISITGDTGGALTGAAFTFAGGTTGLTFAGAGSTETLGGTLAIANGGTNATSMATTDGTVYYDGTRLVTTATGTSGWVLTSGGAGVAPAYAVLPAGGGITTINGDTGSITGATVSFSGDGGFNYAGSSVRFKSTSATAMALFTTDVNSNVFLGQDAGTTTASGGNNVAVGAAALDSVTSGSSNTVIGQGSLNGILSGASNVVIGSGSGNAYTGAESSNVIIGTAETGVIGESNVTRISSSSTTCYVGGIASVSVSNKNYVTINTSTGQLGSDTGPTFFTWSKITANQGAAVNNGYICNKAGTLALALPDVSAIGDIIEVTGINTATGWQITQIAGQQIFFGTTQTTLGATGTLTSSAIRDAIRIVCITANTTWQVLSVVGNISVV